MGELNGTIERITIRSTEIRNEDNVSILVPNSELVQSKVINWNHGNPVSRIHIEFDVAYGTQIENLRDCVMEAVSVHPQLLQYPKPQLVFQGFGDSALNFELLVWVREPRYYLQFRSDLYYLLEQNFRRYQIEIPFPQQEIQLKPRQKITSERLTHPLHPEENLPDSLAIAPPDKTFNKSDMEALQEKLRQVSVLIQQPSSLSDKAIVQLIQQMQGEKGVVVKDRRYGLKTYTDCFIGSEALLWLMAYLKATREEALLCGQMLVEKNFIHHVTYEHTLEDDYLFYQFSQFQSI